MEPKMRSPWPLLAVLTALSVVFAIAWTALALNRNNVDRQGIDIVHHSLILHQLTVPGGLTQYSLGAFWEYPMGAHEVALLLLPCFDGDAIQAVRCLALISLLVMLLAKWVLLGRIMRPAVALLALAAVQAVFMQARVADLNHFLWEGQYNFSRAVGTAALMVLLVALAAPPCSGRLAWLNDVLRIGLAAYALGCHATPGVIAFCTLGWFYLQELRENGLLPGLLKLGVLGGAASALYFGTNAFAMMKYASMGGWQPVRGEAALLAGWLPTWLVMSGLGVRQLWRPRPGPWSDGVGRAVLCGMVASGTLQAYLTLRCQLGQVTPYTVKSTLFVTVTMAALVWLRALVLLLERRPMWTAVWQRQRFCRGVAVVAAAAAVFGMVNMLRRDVQRPYYGAERDPVEIVRVLQASGNPPCDYYYFDPKQPIGSLFVNVAGLHREMAAPLAADEVRKLSHVLLPRGEDPAVLGAGVAAEPYGIFLKCALNQDH